MLTRMPSTYEAFKVMRQSYFKNTMVIWLVIYSNLSSEFLHHCTNNWQSLARLTATI
jgi:GTPase SAR1 family protein